VTRRGDYVTIRNANFALGSSLRTGDRDVLNNLYQRLGRPALSKLVRLVGRKTVAEEILQDVFLRLWRADVDFPDEKAAFAWVYRSCHNAGVDYLRSALSKSESHHAADVDLLPSEFDFAVRVEDRQLILRALETLSERDSQILLYSVVDGMTQEEIAQLLDLSRKTIVRSLASIHEKLVLFRQYPAVHHKGDERRAFEQ